MNEERILELLENLDRRLQRLETYLIQDPPSKPKISKPSSSSTKSYSGVSGGIKFLIDNDFFKKPKSMREVFDELKREGYFHSLQSVDTTLRRNFVTNRRELTRLKDDKIWKYVIRK